MQTVAIYTRSHLGLWFWERKKRKSKVLLFSFDYGDEMSGISEVSSEMNGGEGSGTSNDSWCGTPFSCEGGVGNGGGGEEEEEVGCCVVKMWLVTTTVGTTEAGERILTSLAALFRVRDRFRVEVVAAVDDSSNALVSSGVADLEAEGEDFLLVLEEAGSLRK